MMDIIDLVMEDILIAKINFSDLGDDEKSYLLVYTTMTLDKIFRENLKKIIH